MEYKFTYLPEFAKTLEKLPQRNRKQVLKKIKMIEPMSAPEIFEYIKLLIVAIDLKTHRLKVGDYRIFVRRDGNTFEFQNIVIRGKAYK